MGLFDAIFGRRKCKHCGNPLGPNDIESNCPTLKAQRQQQRPQRSREEIETQIQSCESNIDNARWALSCENSGPADSWKREISENCRRIEELRRELERL